MDGSTERTRSATSARSEAAVENRSGSERPRPAGAPVEERSDRRRGPTPMFSRYTFRGRRRRNRRTEDGQSAYYVDRHSRFEIVSVMTLLALTIIDAAATLHILDRGGVEANPLMRHALAISDSYFLFAKLGISLVGGVLILVHTRFPGVRKALYVLLFLYAGVALYHAYLMIRIAT